MISVSIIIPCYNEGENIPILISKIKKILEPSNYSNKYELVLINDASTDNTENIIKEQKDKIKFLTFYNLKSNYGKATALDVGILHSTGDIICILDVIYIWHLKHIKNVRFVKQARCNLINGKRQNRRDKKNIKFFSKIYNKIIRILTGSKVEDHFSGIKVFKKKIYDNSDYGGIARFITLIAKKFNYKILEIDIEHFSREKGKSSYNLFDRIILSFKDIFCIIFCIIFNKENLYQFKQLILVCLIIITCISFILFKINYDLKYIIMLLTILFIISVFNNLIENFLKKKIEDKKKEVINSFLRNPNKWNYVLVIYHLKKKNFEDFCKLASKENFKYLEVAPSLISFKTNKLLRVIKTRKLKIQSIQSVFLNIIQKNIKI